MWLVEDDPGRVGVTVENVGVVQVGSQETVGLGVVTVLPTVVKDPQ